MWVPVLRIRIRDPVPFDPWIRDRFFPDPRSPAHIFGCLVTIVCVKSFIILCQMSQIVFCTCSKIKKFYKKVGNIHSCGCSIGDPRIWDRGWIKIRIRDKHPGSTTQLISIVLKNENPLSTCLGPACEGRNAGAGGHPSPPSPPPRDRCAPLACNIG